MENKERADESKSKLFFRSSSGRAKKRPEIKDFWRPRNAKHFYEV
jgi:hypothetical protein